MRKFYDTNTEQSGGKSLADVTAEALEALKEFKGVVDLSQINEWKTKLKLKTVEAFAVGESVCFLRPRNRHIVNSALSKYDPNAPMDMWYDYIQSAWLGGDPAFQDMNSDEALELAIILKNRSESAVTGILVNL